MHSLGYSSRIFILSLILLAFSQDSILAASLRLTWKDNSAKESGFKIERLNGTSYVQIASVAANIQTYTDSTVKTGVKYCYRVRAFNSVQTSAPSNTACGTAIRSNKAISSNSLEVETAATSSAISAATSSANSAPASKWSNYQVTMKIRSNDNGSIGVMFRYLDNDNYYRFSWNAAEKFRHLEKRIGGAFEVLAQDTVPYTVGKTYALQITAEGSSMQIRIDGQLIFSVIDPGFSEGTIALYSFDNAGSIFDDVLVTDIDTGTTLLSDNFDDANYVGWTIIDEGASSGSSEWSAASRALVQNSAINHGDPEKSGTYALHTKGSWKNYRLTFKMRSNDDDALGVLFRFQDSDNYYRFLWDQQGRRRQLSKKQQGAFKILAEDAVPYSTGVVYLMEVLAQGASLQIMANGSEIFSVSDTAFDGGTIGLYSKRNAGSIFDDILVEDLSTGAQLLWEDFNNDSLTGWSVIDEPDTLSGPSSWAVINGQLEQTSNIGAEIAGDPGTFVLY